jgi:hypothetical protein
MNYLIVVAVQFFRWALAWVARELVLLIVMALVTNFFSEFRALLLTFMDFIKDKVLTVFNQIGWLSSQLESKLPELTKKIDRLSLQVDNFSTFVVSKSEQIKTSISEILHTKTTRIKNLLDANVLSKLTELRVDVSDLPIGARNKKSLLKKIDLAAKGATRVMTAADGLEKSINATADKQLAQLTKKIPTLPNIDTTDLTIKMQELTQMIVESNTAITDEIDLIFSKFNEEQVREILETQILSADEGIFESASDLVSSKIKKKIKTPKGKRINWLNLDHNKKAHTKHAKNFKINDIYRILVENFDRDERIALALRFAKKDHFKMRK